MKNFITTDQHGLTPINKSIRVHLCLSVVAVVLTAALLAGGQAPQKSDSLTLPAEGRHLRNVRQLTFGGQNAEAYFSADDRWLIFQHGVRAFLATRST